MANFRIPCGGARPSVLEGDPGGARLRKDAEPYLSRLFAECAGRRYVHVLPRTEAVHADRDQRQPDEEHEDGGERREEPVDACPHPLEPPARPRARDDACAEDHEQREHEADVEDASRTTWVGDAVARADDGGDHREVGDRGRQLDEDDPGADENDERCRSTPCSTRGGRRARAGARARPARTIRTPPAAISIRCFAWSPGWGNVGHDRLPGPERDQDAGDEVRGEDAGDEPGEALTAWLARRQVERRARSSSGSPSRRGRPRSRPRAGASPRSA